MARNLKFTPVVIPQISPWVDEGFSAFEIAEKIGCSLGTLRVRCSQLGISLRHDRSADREATISVDLDTPANKRHPGHRALLTEIVVSMSQPTVQDLQNRATSHGNLRLVACRCGP